MGIWYYAGSAFGINFNQGISEQAEGLEAQRCSHMSAQWMTVDMITEYALQNHGICILLILYYWEGSLEHL